MNKKAIKNVKERLKKQISNYQNIVIITYDKVYYIIFLLFSKYYNNK